MMLNCTYQIRKGNKVISENDSLEWAIEDADYFSAEQMDKVFCVTRYWKYKDFNEILYITGGGYRAGKDVKKAC